MFRLALQLCLLIAFAFLIALIAFAVYKGWNRLDARLWENMPTGRACRIAEAGVQSAITGTLWVIGLTAAICLPVGIAAAIYLEEYADNTRWYNRLLELNIQNLAGVPSIVFGILGLGLIARVLGLGFTVITAAIVLSLLVLPTVIIASREAMRAVPQSIRRPPTPSARPSGRRPGGRCCPRRCPGMATGSILALSRAHRRGGAADPARRGHLHPFNPDSLLPPTPRCRSRSTTCIKEPQAEFQELAAAAIVLLLVILLLMNSAAIFDPQPLPETLVRPAMPAPDSPTYGFEGRHHAGHLHRDPDRGRARLS